MAIHFIFFSLTVLMEAFFQMYQTNLHLRLFVQLHVINQPQINHNQMAQTT